MRATNPFILLSCFFVIFFSASVFAQVDNEFWFAIPLETSGHPSPPGIGLRPANNVSFKISAMDTIYPTKVEISMPANELGFPKRTIIIPPGKSYIDTLAIDTTGFRNIANNIGIGVPLSGKTNRGIKIKSDRDITVYYDFDNLWNRDLFSMKGKNALGTEFYTPFQNIWRNGSYTPKAYSSIEIVATEDGTEIDVYPTAPVQGFSWPGSIHITLNKGEAYSLRANGTSPTSHLSGTRITSNKKIAVIINDDSVEKADDTCKDILGDQLVPTNIIGYKYLVMTGSSATKRPETNFKCTRFSGINNGYIVGQYGTISKSGNAGGVWSHTTPLITSILNSFSFIDSNTGIAVGNSGVILKTTDAGANWTTKASGTGNNLYAIFFADANIGYAVGNNGTIRKTVNGGNTWTGSTSGTGNPLNSVYATTTTIAYAVGNSGVIRKTINGGSTAWTGLASGTGNNLFSVYFTDLNTGYAAGSNGTILKTSNAGTAWVAQASGTLNTLNSIFFADDNVGFAVGAAGTILKTTNAGAAWTAQVSGTTNNLNSVYFIDANTGFAVGDLGTILKTTDGGTTWFSNGLLMAQNFSRGEQIFVTATQPNTTVTFKDTSGTVIFYKNLNSGETTFISPNVDNPKHSSIYIESSPSTPIYVFHITGISCELGGALIPPITDCTGSKIVTVFPNATHTAGKTTEITLNLMIPYDKTKAFNDPSQSHNFFVLTNSNNPNGYPIPGNWFEPNQAAGWAVLSMSDRAFGNPGKNLLVYSSNTFENSKDFFHLGMTNGTDGNTNKYGYFSSFNKALGGAIIGQTESDDYITCKGDTIILIAKNGLDYTWHYKDPDGPPTYVNNPKIANPLALNLPAGNHDFYVDIIQAKCFGIKKEKVSVVVLPQTTARFETDKTVICSPDSILFTNTSVEASKYIWTKQVDSNPPVVLPYNSAVPFTEKWDDLNQSAIQNIRYKLYAEHVQGCNDTISKVITVFPPIIADFSPQTAVVCDSSTINFVNNSKGNLGIYTWDFGDQGSSSASDPSHLYRNIQTTDTTYNIRLVAKSNAPAFCSDTASSTVTVHPLVRAGFTVDTVKGCSPFTVKLYNNSFNRKAIGRYFWDFDYNNPSTLPRDTLSVFTNKDTLYHTYPRNTTPAVKTYTIALKVYDIYGNDCSPLFTRTISVYPEASTLINKPDTSICHGQTISFGSTLADPAVNQFVWNFADGGTSTAKFPSHQFNNNSKNDTIYKVTLLGLSPDYCAGHDTMLVTVHPKIDPQFSLDAPYACAPFTATITNATTGGVVSYEWFDGATLFSVSNNPTLIHNFRNTTNNEVTRDIKLRVKNNGGCKDSVTRQIILYPEIQVGFDMSPLMGCNPLTVNFTNRSNTAVATTLFWEFGDGTSSFVTDPSHIFAHTHSKDTVFEIKLKGTSKYNCKDSAVRSVTVYSHVNADFAIDKGKGCSPVKVNITNASTGGIAQYNWSYGDGNYDAFTPTLQPQSFSHIYENNTTRTMIRTLRLTVRNNRGCSHTVSDSIEIFPKVNANFVTNVNRGCNPLQVAFTYLPTNTPDPASTLFWDFGDGSTAYGKQIQYHTFENRGNTEKPFTTKLYVYSDQLCSDTAEFNIRVYPYIKADFAFNEPVGCSPHTITIKDGSSTAANRYYWNFDDGTTGTSKSASFAKTYQNLTSASRIFKPKLVVAYNVPGRGDVCKDSVTRQVEVYPQVTAAFTQDTTKGCHPLTINFINTSLIGLTPAADGSLRYSWIYGDKGSSFIKEQPHTYYNYSNVDSFYYVKLEATSIFDCKSSITKLISVYPKPKAYIQLDTIMGCPPLRVPIQNKSEAGDIYHWTFEPGRTLDTTTLNKIYYVYDNNYNSSITTFNLKLAVESQHNCWDSTSQAIQLFPKVFADFSPDAAGCSPLLVFFKNSTLNAAKYTWNYGDGTTNRFSTHTGPSHQYFNESTKDSVFTVTLIGESTYRCTDTTTRRVTVYPQPLAAFKLSSTYLVYPDTRINIENKTNPGNWSYRWDFKDGIFSNAKEPVMHEYNNWGSYNVTLRAWSANCTDSSVQNVRIAPPVPIPDFDLTEDGCVPLTVQFTDKSTWGENWLWEFYDGTTSTDRSPSHVFEKPGTYKIKLTVSSSGGSAYKYDEVTVYPKPEVDFTAMPTMAMLTEKMEAPVKFYNKSKLGFNYKWDFGDSTYSLETDPVHIYRAVGSYNVGLHAWTDKGCYNALYKNGFINILGTGFCEFPNAFTPNINSPGDGTYPQPDTKNEVFHPHWTGVVEFHMEIYDRWGEKLFETDDVKKGWNGWYKNKLCKTDVYIWQAKGKFTDGSTFEKAGNLTLLR